MRSAFGCRIYTDWHERCDIDRRRSVVVVLLPLRGALFSDQTRMRTLQLALLVDGEDQELLRSQRILEDLGFLVFATRSFTDAQSFLLSASPDVVVADVRLGEYNGLHLAAYSAFHRPSTRFIITHHVHDPVLAADAARLQAVYIIKTNARDELWEAARRIADELKKVPGGSPTLAAKTGTCRNGCGDRGVGRERA